VTDVVLTGSASRGVADAVSDVELLVISAQPPGHLPLEDLDCWDPPVAGATWRGGFFDGEFVELIWWTPDHVEERVRAIVAGEILDHARLRTAEAITSGIALRGAAHARWVTQLGVYPDGLADRIIADAAATFRDTDAQRRSVQRPGDALVLAQKVVEYAEDLLRIVFARNRVWEPEWKRIALRLEPLAVKPDRLAVRLDAAVRALDLERLHVLAQEALAL
jgi:hypothetical protein